MRTVLRPAGPADRSAVAELLARCKLAPNGFDRQFDAGFAVAETADGAIVGVAGVERYGNVGLFRSAAVDPTARGTGLGAALTRNRLEWARAQGLEALYLLTETAADYWPRFGFERVARDTAPELVRQSEEWAHGCPASAVAMRLDLLETPVSAGPAGLAGE